MRLISPSLEFNGSILSDLESGRSLFKLATGRNEDVLRSYLDGVFILAREGIHGPLLQALLALRQPLVPEQ